MTGDLALVMAVNLVKAVIVIGVLLTGFAYATLFERRVIARMQSRVGPNRAGPQGLLQPIADGIKLLFKENITPSDADKPVYFLAPMISLVVAILAFAVIPLGKPVTITVGGVQHVVPLQMVNSNVALLFLLGVSSLAVYGIVLAGWASNNKYSLIGGLRSSAQMISYELAMGISLIGVVMLAGSLSVSAIVDAQASWWFVVLQPLGFLLYATTALAETNRAPFDLPEAEQELIAGYHTEYTGLRFALFYMAEYINIITVSAVAISLFWGGYRLPCLSGTALDFLCSPPWFVDVLVFTAKMLVALFVFVWIRATIPRLRYDQLMHLGWKVLLPLALLNVALTAVAVYLVEAGVIG
ncbi:MAG: NADH-quinone oxidoreductase subunit NuoH [Anaerolineae bacterium]